MKNEKTLWMPLMTMMTAGFLACSPGPDRQVRDEAVVPDLEQARAAFQESAEQRMRALQDEMKQLKDQVGDTDEVPDVQVRIEQWERRYRELEEKLESKKAATLDEWRAFESEINSALDQLRASYDDLARDLRASLD
jgi:predicted  nucleic acid-binding Zn-ribbon protein